MYLKFFKLKEFPFSITCDEKYFFESAAHAEALANMLYTVQQRKGMVLITGEVGAGKTFLGNMLGSRLGLGCLTVLMSNPPQSAKQLLRALAVRAGMNVKLSADKQSLIEDLEQHLIRLQNRGRLVALILDEAQDLSDAPLEELRLLWNWEYSGQRLIQMVMIGQPELRRKLLEPRWEPLRQRIVLSYHLGPLSADDTAAYIRHRLKVAAEDGSPAEFTPDATADIYAATNGIPRLINVLCDNALLVGYAKGVYCIDRSIVIEVVRDMTCWSLRTPPPVQTAGSEPASIAGAH
jgi:general secretion pathway protein A